MPRSETERRAENEANVRATAYLERLGARESYTWFYDDGAVCLDGTYTLEQLKAIVAIAEGWPRIPAPLP